MSVMGMLRQPSVISHRIGHCVTNWSDGLTINTVSRVQVFASQHSRCKGCLKPRCGDNSKRYGPCFTTPRSKLPPSSVRTFFTVTCLLSEMNRLSSTGECFNGTLDWSEILPRTAVSSASLRLGAIVSIDKQYSRVADGGPLFPSGPITTPWPSPLPSSPQRKTTVITDTFMP